MVKEMQEIMKRNYKFRHEKILKVTTKLLLQAI